MKKLKWAIYFGDKQNNGEYDNGVHMDMLDIPYIEKIEQAQYYDGIIRTLWLEAIGWTTEIRQRWPHVKQIGLSDHPLSSQVSKMHAERQVAYLKDLANLDGLMTLTEEERQWYQTALPALPVVKMGLPFPFETYEARYGKLKNSEKKYIGLGVGASDNDRNFISNVIAFQYMRIHYPDIKGVFLSIPQPLIPYCHFLCNSYPNMFIHERTEMGEFYDILSQCKFVLSLADRNTPGRLQGEAAFFGVPVIGSNRLELQTELFPKLAVTPYQLETAAQLGMGLLANPAIGEALGLEASEKLQKYNYRASRGRFNALLRKITQG